MRRISFPDKPETTSPVQAEPARLSHRVVTFYSYKGGVGRSMAMANIAVLLARDYGLKVLVVDWDLEAPGLHRYFQWSDENLGDGIIDYLDKYKDLVRTPKTEIKADDLSIKKYAQKVQEYDSGGALHLIGAGSQRIKSDYVNKVRNFDWEDFYREWNGAQVIEGLRNEFLEMADVTLIDSRTGITDVGGVCTVQLPDIVVFVFVFNIQNLAGIEQIANELSDIDNPSLKELHRRPELLFLPCRKELTELSRLREWEGIAAERFKKFCDTEKIRSVYPDTATYLRKTSVPYVPYFAYGEELAANSDKGFELAESFEPLIGLMLTNVARKSAEENQLIWVHVRSYLLGNVRLIAVLSAFSAVICYVVSRYSLQIDSFEFFLYRTRGLYAGALGASLAYCRGFQKLAKENSWKKNRRYAMTSFFVALIGGCFIGGALSLLTLGFLPLLILSIAVTFAWGHFVKLMSGPDFVEAFRKGIEESRPSRKGSVAETPHRPKRKIMIGVIAGLVVLMLVGAGAMFVVPRLKRRLATQSQATPAVSPIPSQVATPTPAEISNKKSFTGEFNVGKALELVYGSYDYQKKYAQWRVTDEDFENGGVDRGATGIRPGTVYTAANLVQAFTQGGVQRYFIITDTVPAQYDCHACGPLVGGAVFTQQGDRWQLDSATRLVRPMGGFGSAPKGKLTKIGPDRYGVVFHDGGTGQGYTHEAVSLLAEVGERISEVLSVNPYGGDNGGTCGEDLQPCWKFSSRMDFEPGSNPDYFDIEVTTTGTKSDDNGKIGRANAVKKYAFVNGKYTPAR